MSASDGAIGVLGTGAMGAPIVRTLLRAGREVVIAPRDPARASELEAAGATVLTSAAEVARTAEVVITSLTDVTAIREVLFGDDGLLDGTDWHGLLIETSTIAPDDARSLAVELDDRGVRSLDAPVSGGPTGAEAGTLAVMVGGPEAVFDEARPVLDIIGGRVVRCGPAGAGQVAKACNQLIVMTTITGVAEMLTVAEHAGADPERVREVLLGGYAASPILELHGRRMLDEDFEPGGRMLFHVKDIAAVAEVAEAEGLDLPLFEAARSRVEEVLAEPGGPDLDHSAIYTRYPHGGRREDG